MKGARFVRNSPRSAVVVLPRTDRSRGVDFEHDARLAG
jgi:hypothetical protein